MRGPALAMQRAGEGALRLLPGAVSVPPRNAWQGIELGTRGMKRSTDRILTTHVGSLIRPAELLEHPKRKQSGQGFDEERKKIEPRCRECRGSSNLIQHDE